MYLATHGKYCNSYPAVMIPHLTTQGLHAGGNGYSLYIVIRIPSTVKLQFSAFTGGKGGFKLEVNLRTEQDQRTKQSKA